MGQQVRLPGKRALFEQLRADGVTSVFGNPGTTEQAFMDVLGDYPDVTYYLALHEGVAVAMADAYGRATRKAALVELHIAPGLGNGMGALYNAHVGKSPMVCYVGQSPTDGLLQEPYLSADLVSLARPFSKWATEILTTEDIPRGLRRAFKVAEEPPQGPVVLSIPMDTLDGEADVFIEPTRHVDWRTPPPAGAAEEAARLLAAAEHPALAIGDQISLCDAADAVVDLAEQLGAPIVNAFSNQVNAPTSHPLYQARGSGIPLSSGAVRERLASHDLVVALGTPLFSSIFPDPVGPVPNGTKIIHVDLDSWELGKNHGGELLIKADPGATCQAIAEELRRGADATARETWRQRRRHIEAENAQRREDGMAQHRRESWDAVPISAPRLMAEVANAVTPDTAIFDESITSGRAFETYLQPDQPWQRFRARGGGIGGGLPGTLGLQVAYPDRPVVGVVADGASLFSITGLWTAAHHRLPVTFVVCNNRSYEVLKRNMKQYRGGGEGPYPFMDLTDPEIRFDLIAESFGVSGRRVEQPDELGKALTEAIESDEPALLDVIVG